MGLSAVAICGSNGNEKRILSAGISWLSSMAWRIMYQYQRQAAANGNRQLIKQPAMASPASSWHGSQ